MLSETIREPLKAIPFAPFIIQMNDGRQFKIPHADFATVSPKGGSILVFRDDDAAVQLSALLVASVEPVASNHSENV